MTVNFVLMVFSVVKISCAQPQCVLPFVPNDRIPEITRRPSNFDIYDPFRSTTRQSGTVFDDEVVVRLSVGQLIGKKIIIDNLAWSPDRDFHSEDQATSVNYKTPIFTFLGVPYAQKPVGSLRFQLPQKLPRLPSDVYFADKFRAVCAQDVESRPNFWFEMPYEHHVDEDCLYLNVFTPQASLVAAKNFPVILFFHGGNFQTGGSNDWPAYVLSTKGLVVVTANYRLGAFGFLSLGGRQANLGLWDQKLVLEWIQENIYAFGGDKSRVTIVGHDAGAVSAGLHMLSPFSAGLASSVAALSGAEVSYHQVISHPMLAYNNTLKLGRMVGCFSLKSGDILECLKTRSTRDIISGTRDMLIEFNRYSFLPTVDKNFLPDSPESLLNRKEVASPLPYLTGINVHDGAEVLLSERRMARYSFNINPQFIDYYALDYVLKRNYTTNQEAVIDAIKYLYTFWPDKWSNEKVREQFVKMATDAYYLAPVSLSARLHSESGSMVFMYVNAYNFSTGARNPGQNFLPSWMSICHDCELYLLFGFPWMPKQFLPIHLRNVSWTDSDKNASEIFMSMIKKFAETKNPNLQHESTWVNYGPRDHNYLLFNGTRRTMGKSYEWEHVAFWNYYIDQLATYMTTTFSPTVVAIRRELVYYRAGLGIFSILLALAIVVAGTLSYFLLEKGKRQRFLATTPAATDSLQTTFSFDSRTNFVPLVDYPSSTASGKK